MPLRVICIGAGVAGLSAAIACRENASSIVLLEAAESIAKMNIRAAGLAIHSCGAHVMRNVLGLEPVADVDAVKGQSIKNLSWADGSLLKETSLPHQDWYTAHRGSLLDALLRKATSAEEKGVAAQLLLGKRVKDVDVESGRVVTEDGSIYDADVIIGGDGVRSVARKAIVEEAIVEPSGFSVYRWTMTQADWKHLSSKNQIDSLIGPNARHIIICDSDETRLVTYRCHASGVVNGLLVLPDHSLPQTSEDWDTAGNIEHLRFMVKDICEPLRSMVGCVKSCGLWQLRKQVPLRRWNKGKAIILGDAAHPMLPFQSAAGALAMEDAEALQYCLSEVNWEPERVPEALSRTFCLRFLRCSIIQHFSNAGPFRSEVVDNAAKWSLQHSAINAGNNVPIMKRGADDLVQLNIASKVAALIDEIDRLTPSNWVIGYKLQDFLKTQQEYILEAPYA